MQSLLERNKHPLSQAVMFLDKKKVVIAKEIARVCIPDLVDRKTYGFIAGPSDTEIEAFAISGWKYFTTPSRKVLPNGVFMQFVRQAAEVRGEM